jgi:hypothetical protein
MRTGSKSSSFIKQTIASTGFTVSKLTNKELVLDLIKSLQPFGTDKKLIRLGKQGDGGYLVPDDLEGIAACFSPGIGESSAFELDCVNYGMDVFLADKSVDGPKESNDKFHFIKKFIGPLNNEDFITMDRWVNDSLKEQDSDLMLEMDIEGHEYLSIVSMSDHLISRFRILVIEFHFLDKLWNPEFFKVASAAFGKILQNHTCVHIHPNNCCGVEKLSGIEIPRAMEFTFIRNDRVRNVVSRQDFPHHLDFDCTSKKTLILPEIWYSK